MDYKSLSQFEGKNVKITLWNRFWYRARIISVSPETIVFIEERGKKITVSPSAISIIEGVEE